MLNEWMMNDQFWDILMLLSLFRHLSGDDRYGLETLNGIVTFDMTNSLTR